VGRRPAWVALLGLLAGLVLLAVPVRAQARRAPVATRVVPDTGVAYDARLRHRGPIAARASAARTRLRRKLGRSAIVDSDPLTGGLRLLGKRDGYLTGRSSAGPRRIALDYVAAHPAAFGLDHGDLGSLELTRSYRSQGGIVHLQWRQTYRGIPSFDQGLEANVAADGRLINVGGAPRADLAVASTKPTISAADALRVVAASAGARVGRGGLRRTSLVLFGDSVRERLAWRVLLSADAQHVFDAVVDASTGALLYRNNLVKEATGLAYDNYPGAAFGGTQALKDLTPWLSSGTQLVGPNAWVYADPSNTSTPVTIPSSGGNWNYGQTAVPASSCPPVGCSWNSATPSSQTTNRNQGGTQLFFFINRFHDHLRDAPGIGFNAASGSFDGADPVYGEVDDGASTGCAGMNNGSMIVFPDGNQGVMQISLWSSICEPGVFDVNGADDAFIVDHEYTHGLSQRLVTSPDGFGALDGQQSGAMGEGISDWYSLDYLVAAGLWPDSAAPGELRAGVYENVGVRTQPFDCPVGASAAVCPGSGSAGSGGYTYGDFGKILGFPEVHADGEIWAETVWDLRSALIAAHGAGDGTFRARALITDGMRLSPANPTFLDMRNAILQADTAHGFGDRDRIWAVFAARGMGVYAGTSGDNDTHPVEDFTTPPPTPAPPTPDTTPAVISSLSMSHSRFRVSLDRTPKAAAARRKRRAPTGSAFRFRLSEGATVVITIEQALPGRRVGKSCRKPTKRLRHRKRCTRYQKRGSLTRRKRKAGRNTVGFSGRIGLTPLHLGRHRATLSATDAAGNRSKRRYVSFTIVRR
jgi:extracellular elastinolytic metalloproteinase